MFYLLMLEEDNCVTIWGQNLEIYSDLDIKDRKKVLSWNFFDTTFDFRVIKTIPATLATAIS